MTGNREKGKKNENYTTKEKFSKLKKISKSLLKNIEFTYMTEIQSLLIPKILEGRDVMAKAKTGSGKTLAFLVPLINKLINNKKIKSSLIITPTRELAIQIQNVFKVLARNIDLTSCLIIGGSKNYKKQVTDLKNSHMIIATPGRIMEHLQDINLDLSSLNTLTFDEADRLLDMGFKKEIDNILGYLPKKKQVVLCSATLNVKGIGNLSSVAMKDPVNVFTQDESVSELKQKYICVRTAKKLEFLWNFLEERPNEKIIVFFGTNSQVKFCTRVFEEMRMRKILALCGHQNPNKRTKIFLKFQKAEKGVLFTTDVSSRGLDMENISWTVQFEPTNGKDYVHRIGRSARGGLSGNSLVMLRYDDKESYLEMLKTVHSFPDLFDNCSDTNEKFEEKIKDLISREKSLEKLAKKVKKQLPKYYRTLKNVEKINESALTLQLGLVDTKIKQSLGKRKRKESRIAVSTRNPFKKNKKK